MFSDDINLHSTEKTILSKKKDMATVIFICTFAKLTLLGADFKPSPFKNYFQPLALHNDMLIFTAEKGCSFALLASGLCGLLFPKPWTKNMWMTIWHIECHIVNIYKQAARTSTGPAHWGIGLQMGGGDSIDVMVCFGCVLAFPQKENELLSGLLLFQKFLTVCIRWHHTNAILNNVFWNWDAGE